MQSVEVVHCKLPPWERCTCGVVLRRFKQFGDFVCLRPKNRDAGPRELVST